MTMYLLCSVDKSRGKSSLVWWRPETRGYTQHLDAAGTYNEHEARRLASPTSFAVPEEVAVASSAGKRVPAAEIERLRMHRRAIRMEEPQAEARP